MSKSASAGALSKTPNECLGGVPTLVYFDLTGMRYACGRGGAVRLFLLAAGCQLEEKRVPLSEWAELKKALIESGDNPAGKVPVVLLNGRTLTETHAILRRFATQLGLYGNDLEWDYATDILADSALAFRDALGAVVLGDEAARTAYTGNTRPAMYRMLEARMTQTTQITDDGTTQIGGDTAEDKAVQAAPAVQKQPEEAVGATAAGAPSTTATPPAIPRLRLSYAHAVLFAALFDDTRVFGRGLLRESLELSRFFEAFRSQHPGVETWCATTEPLPPPMSAAEAAAAAAAVKTENGTRTGEGSGAAGKEEQHYDQQPAGEQAQGQV